MQSHSGHKTAVDVEVCGSMIIYLNYCLELSYLSDDDINSRRKGVYSEDLSFILSTVYISNN